jgi:UDP-3-O-[3-hydroxymyristoyl] glucosamine N-acyltransferase
MNSTLLVSAGFMAVFAFAVTTTDMINTTGNKIGLLLAEAQQLASGVTIGNNTTMGSSVTIGNNTTMGSSVTIGNNASIAENTRISQGASIGDNTRISQSVNVAENVKIGRGASIGENTTIAQGVNIGGGTSIGGGANIGENVAATGGGGQINSNVTIPANSTIPQPSPGGQNLTAQATPINITRAVATPSSAACDDDGTVTLEGTVSPMVPITASWEQTGGEPDVDIMGSETLISTFAIPGCDDIDGGTTLTFRLTVIDEQGITADVASVGFVVTDAVAADEEEG